MEFYERKGGERRSVIWDNVPHAWFVDGPGDLPCPAKGVMLRATSSRAVVTRDTKARVLVGPGRR